ncbi:UNVERIFIED_CONTAM: hypothetical protein Scaly_2572900 [Sesamum calycinum]|uniref:DUF4283 domain-containing protein n=1 Tax=Sesamum calycinum TaxID=2727403 RepID=A0AAW2JKH1_9LAMI
MNTHGDIYLNACSLEYLSESLCSDSVDGCFADRNLHSVKNVIAIANGFLLHIKRIWRRFLKEDLGSSKIKLRHLQVEFWADEVLSTVVSGIGKPLYQDTITKACTRLDFARVCIMLNISSKLLKHVIIMVPNETGNGVSCKVDVEYEWVPPKCAKCMCLGHLTVSCQPQKTPLKPLVAVYVQKIWVPTTPMPKSTAQPIMEESRSMTEPIPSVLIFNLQQPDSETSNDKELVLCNPFDALTLDDDEIANDKLRA